jgi:D-alanine-D-alanine ligase
MAGSGVRLAAAVTTRIRVGVLMGGASAERPISLASGRMIAEHLPRDRYEVVLLDTLALMGANPRLPPALRERARALGAGGRGPEPKDEREQALPASFREEIEGAAASVRPATEALAGAGFRIDVAFLALHGPYGEDGTIQGMLDILGLPYVGSGVLASALAMDKEMAKKVLSADGIPVPKGLVLERGSFRSDEEAVLGRAAALLPAVVKPARQGSSIGLSLVTEAANLLAALGAAFAHDDRVLVEERVVGRELTVGVIGNRDLTVLPVVEIVCPQGLFDYEAKYDPARCEEVCPARLPPSVAAAAQDLARRAHRALGCRGLSRTDMILASGGLVVLEVNTLPGMTVNSLLPKAARAAGIPFGDLLDRLLQLALEREP